MAPFPLEGEASGGNTQSQSPRLGQEGDIGQSCGDQAAGHVQPAGTCTTDAKTLKQIYRGLPFQLQWFGCTKGNFEAGNCNYIYIYIKWTEEMGWAPNHKCVNGQYQSKKLPGTREPQCNRCATLGTSVVTCLLWQSLWGALDFSVKLERNANSNKKKKVTALWAVFLR